ncbi:unnamed protein product [Victoria cruziana]
MMDCLCFRHSGVDEAHVTRGGRGTSKASSRKASASALANGIVLSEKAVGGFQRSGSDDSTKKRERHSRTDRLGGSHTLTTTNLHPRVRSMPRGVEGEQVAAGWPPWLASVAGEAIKGWIPRRADSFEKLNKIGQGTYSNVYRARDLDSGKVVALKKVRFDNLEPESVRFMAREIHILRRLDHPNVIKLEGLVTSRISCSLYLVFGYMEHDLAGLASNPGIVFAEPQIKCFMQQLLRGLDHCHSRGVLHRDIKGSNLLIDNNGTLKIADFGLATFFYPGQKQPLTSRVVTLWYRPPELLLGATEYGVSVDLWSTGCILAELFARKPVMPGRTEVEQLHKIFKLCGSPTEAYWEKLKLPNVTTFKPQQRYRRCVAETFKEFPPSALELVDVLLAIDPGDRGTAASALKSEFFTTKPYGCDPSSLPKYPPSKEMDAKRRDETRKQRSISIRGYAYDPTKKGRRELKAMPAPEANAELPSSLQKTKVQSGTKSTSEKFHVNQEETPSGFPIDPPRQQAYYTDEASIESRGHHQYKVSHSGPLIHLSAWTERHKNEGSTSKGSLSRDSSSLSSFVATGRSAIHDNYKAGDILFAPSRVSHNTADQAQLHLPGRLSTHQMKYAKTRQEQSLVHPRGQKGNKILYSGPLIQSENIDQMLQDHERHIQEAVRQSRLDRARNKRTTAAYDQG